MKYVIGWPVNVVTVEQCVDRGPHDDGNLVIFVDGLGVSELARDREEAERDSECVEVDASADPLYLIQPCREGRPGFTTHDAIRRMGQNANDACRNLNHEL